MFKGIRELRGDEDYQYSEFEVKCIAKYSKDKEAFFSEFFQDSNVVSERFSLVDNVDTILLNMLHEFLFQRKDRVFVINSNTLKKSCELLLRFKELYMQLPLWMQSPVGEYKKTLMRLHNGNEIRAVSGVCGMRGYGIDYLALIDISSNDTEELFDFLIPVVSGRRGKIYFYHYGAIIHKELKEKGFKLLGSNR